MKGDIFFSKHILDYTKLIEETIGSLSKEEFKKDVNLVDATLRRMEVLGEAVKNISNETKKKYPNIEWKRIAGTRDIIIHAYFDVDINIIWDIVKDDIPKLRKYIKDVLKKS